MHNLLLVDSGIKAKKNYSRRFVNLKDIQRFLVKMGIKSTIIGDSIYGNYFESNNGISRVPVINYSKFVKKLKINGSIFYSFTLFLISSFNRLRTL